MRLVAAIICLSAAAIILMLFIQPNGGGFQTTIAVFSAGTFVGIGFNHILKFAERNPRP